MQNQTAFVTSGNEEVLILTIRKSSPSRHITNLPNEGFTIIGRKTYWNDVFIESHRRFQLKKSQVIVKSSCNEVFVNNDTSYVTLYRFLGFIITRNVHFPKNDNQRSQKSRERQFCWINKKKSLLANLKFLNTSA